MQHNDDENFAFMQKLQKNTQVGRKNSHLGSIQISW